MKNEKNEYICEKCSYKTYDKSNYIKHLKTKRHNQDIIEKKYICGPCSFVTTDRCNYARHINTQKHKILTCDIQNKMNEFECPVCGKSYTHSSSLSRHLKICKPKESEPAKMLGLSEEKIYEIIKNAIDKPSTANNYNKCKNTINNQNTFNLQLFLNNECKDAITLIEFVSNIKLKLKDLEDTAQHGFVETMTNLMTESLKELDITKRPIHSSDAKRGIMYVKDEAGWDKDKDHSKMAAAINKVSKSNMRQIPEWVKENPKANNAGTKENDKFMKILETTVQDDEAKHAVDVEKVIKKIAKSVTIEK
jgi:hypothetical protein